MSFRVLVCVSKSVLVFAILTFSVTSTFATSESSKTWKLLQKRAVARNGVSGKSYSMDSKPSVQRTTDNQTISRNAGLLEDVHPVDGSKAEADTLRQYGHSHYSSYGGGGSGSYDIYTLLAVSAFAALFGALFFELATGSSKHSHLNDI
jgi:hypothetical protein